MKLRFSFTALSILALLLAVEAPRTALVYLTFCLLLLPSALLVVHRMDSALVNYNLACTTSNFLVAYASIAPPDRSRTMITLPVSTVLRARFAEMQPEPELMTRRSSSLVYSLVLLKKKC